VVEGGAGGVAAADRVRSDPTVPVFDEQAHIKTVWDSAETRNELLEAQTLELLQRLGLSKRTALRVAGYDPDQEESGRAQEAEAASLAAQKAFGRWRRRVWCL